MPRKIELGVVSSGFLCYAILHVEQHANLDLLKHFLTSFILYFILNNCLQIELSTPNYFDTYYWPELKRVEEKAALDAKIEVEVRERLHKIEKQFMCKTPKSPKELINLNSPGPSTTTQSTTSVAPPRPPPPGRPPPPKISASHSMGDLAKCNRPVITTGVVHSTDHENIG